MPRKMKIKTTDRTIAPAGYTLVTEGAVRKSDLVWDSLAFVWMHPTTFDFSCLGTKVSDYYAVARKIKGV